MVYIKSFTKFQLLCTSEFKFDVYFYLGCRKWAAHIHRPGQTINRRPGVRLGKSKVKIPNTHV